MPPPFKGKVNVDVRDSVPDWEPYMPPRAPEGAPNVLIVLYDDTGLAAWSPFGGRIDMPTMQRLADNGLTLHAVAHHRAVLADALVLPHRPQPPPERLRLHRGGATGFPGSNAHIPLENALAGRGAARATAGTRTGSARTTTCPVDECDMGASKRNWPLQPGLRPLLRLHRRRDQPVVSRPGRGQPLRRPAVPARGRLPPLQGPGRQGASRFIRDSKQIDARQALVHVVLPGRQPRAAPRARRSGSTSTRASSTTATRPTASGCCRA